MDIYGFFHFHYTEHLSNIIIRWAQIFEEVFHSIELSGLLEETKKLTIFIVGIDENHKNAAFFKRKTSKYKNIELIFIQDPKCYEFLTLRSAWETCQNNDCYIYYCHSKGASYSENKGFRRIIRADHWRTKMTICTIVNWRKCVSLLDRGYFTCGVEMDGRGKFADAYSGNFFWASSHHIRKLCQPKLEKDRYDAEHWIKKSLSPHAIIGLEETRLVEK